MIITRTPFRMSFFGGGTDFAGYYENSRLGYGTVLSTALNMYVYIMVCKRFDNKIRVCYRIQEMVDSVDEVQHNIVREAMKIAGITEGIDIVYSADIPMSTSGVGLASSSAFAVGMLEAFYALKGKYADKRKLADDAIHLERVLCAEAGGIQDQIAASFGGLNRINFSADGYTVNPVIISPERKKTLNDNLMLFFTGISRFSSEIQKTTEKSMKDKTQELLKMYELVDQAEQVLVNKDRDLDDFGRLLDYTWQLKRGISSGISSDSIDEQYNAAMKAGALGGKLLGAGGGGFLLFYVPKEKQDSVRAALKNQLHVPFKFENEGTTIVMYQAEDFED